MLREILAITGRPGLVRIVSQGKGSLIVEDIIDKKRFPVHARDKVVSLGDIAMYTDSDDKPLGEILDLLYAHYDGQKIDVKSIAKAGGLKEEFGAVLTDFDRDRVHDNDIKKLFTWYNLLLEAGFTKFADEELAEEEPAEEA